MAFSGRLALAVTLTLSILILVEAKSSNHQRSTWSLRNPNIQHLIKGIVMQNVSCLECSAAVTTLRYFFKFTTDVKKVEKAVSWACIHFHLSPPQVCPGVVKAFAGEVLYVLTRTTLTSKQLCTLFLSQNCAPLPASWDSWAVQMPQVPKPPVQPVPAPKNDAPTFRVLHITDVHMDQNYVAGSQSSCSSQLCCHLDSVSVGSKPSSTAGLWGDYGKCDTPVATYKLLLDHVSRKDKIDMIVWTGDVPPHDIWNQSRSGQIRTLRSAIQLLTRYFPNTPVFPAIGNHESAPVDSFPPPGIQVATPTWLYEELTRSWSHWLPNETSETILRGGYYSVGVFPGFRVIALNNNYCDGKNMWLFVNPIDPTGQLSWLVDELLKAEENGEKVYILGHIPPGSMDCLSGWSRNYYNIIYRFESTVAAQFFGHTHADEFEVFYDSNSTSASRRATNMAYVGPSVTPYSGYNPGYRIYVVDGNYTNCSWAVIDHENYFLNLTEANSSPQPQWEQLYSAKSTYEMNSLQPSEWDNLIRKMRLNDTLFQSYYKFYSRGSPTSPACDHSCKDSLICDMQSAHASDTTSCIY